MSERDNTSAVRQEAPDISGKTTVLAGAAVVAVSIVSVLVMAWILRERTVALGGASEAPIAAPAPSALRIEQSRVRLSARGQALQAEAERRLSEWGWVVEGEVVRIPVDAAARWLLEDARRGKLSWAAPHEQPSPSASPSNGAP